MKFLKAASTLKEEIRDAVYLMRFRREVPKPTNPIYATYTVISQTLNLNYNTV